MLRPVLKSCTWEEMKARSWNHTYHAEHGNTAPPATQGVRPPEQALEGVRLLQGLEPLQHVHLLRPG